MKWSINTEKCKNLKCVPWRFSQRKRKTSVDITLIKIRTLFMLHPLTPQSSPPLFRDNYHYDFIFSLMLTWGPWTCTAYNLLTLASSLQLCNRDSTVLLQKPYFVHPLSWRTYLYVNFSTIYILIPLLMGILEGFNLGLLWMV